MRVLITGITGFVGGHLARDLLENGHRVFGMSSDGGGFEGVDMLEADVRDRPAIEKLVARCDPEVIVHLAGLSHVGESWRRPGDYLQVNFVGTRNLLNAAAGRRMLFASSAEVYGQVPEAEQPISEERPVSPRSPYAMTKACSEVIALDRDAIVVRSFNSVGVGQARHFALPSFTSQLAAIERGEGEPVLRVGDLSPRRDFLHVADAASGYRTLIESGEPGTVYNLASGEASSIEKALDLLRRISGVEAEVQVDPERVRPVDIPLLLGDNSRLRSLGWQPRDNGLGRAMEELWREIRREAGGDSSGG
jgi:GDP-4-dehydro-6-deoxy-D-mannose reductase